MFYTDRMDDRFFADYHRSSQRLLLLDYDGTLTPIVRRPEQATPTSELRTLLAELAGAPNTTCVIISGRPHETLEQWLGDLPLGFVAEHGVWRKLPGQDWSLTGYVGLDWKPTVRDVMAALVNQLPGSAVEEKHAALAFHYREASSETVDADVNRLFDDLQKLSGYDKAFKLIHGKKVIEAVAAGIDKGTAARWWLGQANYDFVCAIGDDTTDEALFAALPSSSYTIHVGNQPTGAGIKLDGQPAVIELLERLQRLDTRP